MLYPIDSDAQQDMIVDGENQAAVEREGTGIQDPDDTLLIMKVTTPDELDVNEVLQSWSDSGGTAQISDPRGR